MNIIISLNNGLVNEYTLEIGTFYNLGKSKLNDIIVDDIDISDTHLQLEVLDEQNIRFYKKNDFAIIYLNGVIVNEGIISNDDVISIGSSNIYIAGKTQSEKTSFTIGFFDKNDAVYKEPPKLVNNSKSNYIEENSLHTKQEINNSSFINQENTNATMVGVLNLFFKLEAISGPFQGRNFILDANEYTLGRNPENSIVLVDDLVSRYHASLTKDINTYKLNDLGSANGVLVNGQKIFEPFKLSSGDVVEVGSSVFRFVVINKQLENMKADYIPKAQTIKQNAVQEVPSDTKIIRVEESFGLNKKKSKNKKLFIYIFILIGLAGYYYYSNYLNKKEPEKITEPVKTESVFKTTNLEEPEEQILLDPSFEGLPIGVQRQLLSELEVGIKLYENAQFELCEDRAKQILNRVSNYTKAKDLLEACSFSKEEEQEKKQSESQTELIKIIEEKTSSFLKDAKKELRSKNKEKAKEQFMKVLELDPSNKEAQNELKKLEEQEKKQAESRALQQRINKTFNDAKNDYNKAEELFNKQNYRLAYEAYLKLTKINNYGDERIKEIVANSTNRLKECLENLNEIIIPELAVADELFNSGQFKIAIDTYKRVLNIDYTSIHAKERIKLCEQAISEAVADIYKRAAISESLSDIENACLLYNLTIDKAIKDTKYYKQAKAKVKKLCR